jgi:hypothetical protein
VADLWEGSVELLVVIRVEIEEVVLAEILGVLAEISQQASVTMLWHMWMGRFYLMTP